MTFREMNKQNKVKRQISKLQQTTSASAYGYFKSYLNRMPNYDSNICQFCNTKENPEHLLLHCRRYSQIRSRIKQEKQLNQLSLKILFGTKLGQDFLFEFLKETSI